MQKTNNHQTFLATITTILFSCLVGTYADLFFVSKHMYEFPVRPFPNVFTINIAFTLLILPAFTLLFLQIAKIFPVFSRILFIILIGLCMSIFEQFTENLGWFIHSEAWHHSYSFFGYVLFMLLLWSIYRWFQ